MLIGVNYSGAPSSMTVAPTGAVTSTSFGSSRDEDETEAALSFRSTPARGIWSYADARLRHRHAIAAHGCSYTFASLIDIRCPS